MKIRLNNNKEYDVLVVNGNKRYYQGAERDILEIRIENDKYSFDEIEKDFSDSSNTSKMYIIDNDNIEYLYENYTLRAGMGIKNISDNSEESKEVLTIEMAQKNYTENLIDNMRDTLDMLVIENLGGGLNV